jgi:thiamine kinase-like enzyme
MAGRTLMDGLRAALANGPWAGVPLAPLPDTGLAHWHVRLRGTGLLARIPKQSQMGLWPQDNLRHQQACFERAVASGHTPRLFEVLPAGAPLARGALLVEEIAGRPAVLPDDLEAIAQALAALHALALPPPPRAPLVDAADPLRELLDEIDVQAAYLGAAGLALEARSRIEAEMPRLQADVQRADRPPRSLIAFDAHPGNFLLRAPGDAVLVDLEKCRYSHAGLDLAHATLYTSTTWDARSSAALSPHEVAGFYAAWERAVPAALAAAARVWQVPLRRAMWLWSITWCCKWRALAHRPAQRLPAGEDWSTEHSDAALAAHVRGRVDHYLSAAVVAHVQDELTALQALFEA